MIPDKCKHDFEQLEYSFDNAHLKKDNVNDVMFGGLKNTEADIQYAKDELLKAQDNTKVRSVEFAKCYCESKK